MNPKPRRAFLKNCLQSVPGFLLADRLQALTLQLSPQAAASAAKGFHSPDTLDHYVDPMPVPPKHIPVEKGKKATVFHVSMEPCEQKMHSQLPPTRFWGFGGHYPGPTFDVSRGQPVEVIWENKLPLEHIFPIDPHIHGAMPPSPHVRTVPHLHGSRTDSVSDGLPEKWFVPGKSAHYFYPNDQCAATLWYHDHALGITRLNVYAGMSGFYLLRDEEERSLGLPEGDYEIPIVLQDRSVDEKGQLVYAPTHEDGEKLPPGLWGPEFFGDFPVANGVIYPYFEVEPRPYRLRFLNGCNARFLNLYFNLAKSPTDIPNLLNVRQIGTDGGLLLKPAVINKLLLGPAERADLIVDFSSHQGKTVTLSNNAAAPYPGWGMLNLPHPQLYEWMEFRVTKPLAAATKSYVMPPPNTAFPITSFTKLDPKDAVITRDLVIAETLDAQGRSLGVHINDKGYDDPVTETPRLGTIEKWRFINTTDDSHPMHLHLVQFQILERQGFNPAEQQLNGTIQLVGKARPPLPSEAGWKDTATVNPRDVLTILAKFEGFTGRYVFHCHMLEHEDNDMMRPYEVIAAEPKKS
jgi:spore coat protein A